MKRKYSVMVTSAQSAVQAAAHPERHRHTYEEAYSLFTTICSELDAQAIPPMPAMEMEITCECRQYFVHLKISTNENG